MYGRNKIDPFDTINMCNQFLIVHLIKKIQSFQARGLNKNAMVFRNAINSIKKYPLPIICKTQLQSLNGIGQYISQDLQKVIKKHYQQYLDSNLQQKNSINHNSSNNNFEDKQKQQKGTITNINNKRQKQQQQNDSLNDSKTTRSNVIQYKPRANTANAYLLQVLRDLYNKKSQFKITGVSKQTIQQMVQSKFPSAKNKTWKTIQQILDTNGYIKIQKISQQYKKDKLFYKLTQKGLDCVNKLDGKIKNNQTKNKVINQVKKFKQQIIKKKNIIKKPSSNNLQNFYIQNYTQQQQQQIQKKLIPKLLLLKQQQINFQKLFLVIDNRQKKQKNQQINFFSQKITKKFKIQCKNSSLSLGDFIWVYDNQVLNYVIQRKKADDLAASILDGRYKDQKYRLNNCGVTNIYYIYEGYPSDNCCLSQKQLHSALLKTRFKQDFHVCKTKDVSETMNLLNVFHMQIYQSILSSRAQYLCTLDEFNDFNSIQKSMTVGKIYALGLMSIPGVGKNSVKVITQYFKTFRAMHDSLQKLQSNDERIQFLKILFKGTGIGAGIPKILVQLLFCEDYGDYIQDQDSNRNKQINIFNEQIQQKQQLYNNQQIRYEKRRFSIIHQQQYNEQNQEKQYQI